MILPTKAKWLVGLLAVIVGATILVLGLYRLRDGAHAVVKEDLRAVVSALALSDRLLFFERDETLQALPGVVLERAKSETLCSWLSNLSNLSKVDSMNELKNRYGDLAPDQYFVHAYVPTEGSSRCLTEKGSEPLEPAVYVAVRPPLPAKGQITYLRISFTDGSDTVHFGARINPEETVHRKDRRPRKEYAVVPYQLADARDFLWNTQPQPGWLQAWWPETPDSETFENSLIRLRLRLAPEGATRAERAESSRRFVARDWKISAEMQLSEKNYAATSFERKRRALTISEIAAGEGIRAIGRCIEVRLATDESTAWRASEPCGALKPGGWPGLASLAAALIDGDLAAGEIVSTQDDRVLMLRFPQQVLVQRLTEDLNGLVWIAVVVAGTALGVWAYLMRGLRSRVKTLATAARHDDAVIAATGAETDLLEPLVSAIVKAREQRAQLKTAHHLSEERSRAFRSTAGAFRHELTEFVSASILVLQRGPLSEADRTNLLSNARLAHLIIKKIDAIRRKEPLKALGEELQGTSPEWISLRTIFDWWKNQIDPELLRGQVRIRDSAEADVWAAIGPVIWIMTRFQENALRHGTPVEGAARFRVGTRRMRAAGYVAITFTNFTEDFEPEDVEAVFNINRHAISKRIQRREQVEATDLSGVGLYAARQYALLTEGLVECRYRRLSRQLATVSFSVALKTRDSR